MQIAHYEASCEIAFVGRRLSRLSIHAVVERNVELDDGRDGLKREKHGNN